MAWATIKEACQHLHISEATFRRYQRAGKLPKGVGQGRAKRYDLAALDAAFSTPVESPKPAADTPKTPKRRSVTAPDPPKTVPVQAETVTEAPQAVEPIPEPVQSKSWTRFIWSDE